MSGDGPSISLSNSVDPGSASPAAVRAQYVLRSNYVYDLPFSDAGVVLNRARSVWPFPSANYGSGAVSGGSLQPQMRIRIDCNRAMVVSTLRFRFRLRTLCVPGSLGSSTGGTITTARRQMREIGLYSIQDAVMRLDNVHDMFEEVAIRHLNGADICRVRDAALIAKMMRICNEQRPPPRWSLYARPMRGAYHGLGPWQLTFASSTDSSAITRIRAVDGAPYTSTPAGSVNSATATVNYAQGERRAPTTLSAQITCIDEVGDDVYNGANLIADEDLQRAMHFSSSNVLQGAAGQEQSSAQLGRLFTVELPVPCFRDSPVWPGLMGGMLIDILLRDSSKAFKPVLPRMDHQLGNAPVDWAFYPAYSAPSVAATSTTSGSWEYQLNDPEIVMDTLQLSATFESAVQTAAQGSGLPFYWTQPRLSRVAVANAQSDVLARVESAASNVVGVIVATISQSQYDDPRQWLVFGNPWTEFSIRLGTSVIPNGRPWTGPDQSYRNLRDFFPVLPGFPGGVRRVDWEGSSEMVFHCAYRSADTKTGQPGGSQANTTATNVDGELNELYHVPQVFGHLTLFNPNRHLWVWDARTTKGVPLTGVSTTNLQMTLSFRRPTVAFPTQVSFYLGASSDGQAYSNTVVPSLGLGSVGVIAATTATGANTAVLPRGGNIATANNHVIVDGLVRPSSAAPCVIAPKGTEACHGFRNYMGDIALPIFIGGSTAAAALTAYQSESARTYLPLQQQAVLGTAGAGPITDTNNTCSLQVVTSGSSNAGQLYKYGTTTAFLTGSEYMPAHPGPHTDLVLLILTLSTILVLVGPSGVTVRE